MINEVLEVMQLGDAKSVNYVLRTSYQDFRWILLSIIAVDRSVVYVLGRIAKPNSYRDIGHSGQK